MIGTEEGKEAANMFCKGRKENGKCVRDVVQIHRYQEKAAGGYGVKVDKGKSSWIPRKKATDRCPGYNGSLWIGSNRGLNQEEMGYESDSSISSSDTDSGPQMKGKWALGECSKKRPYERYEVTRQDIGPEENSKDEVGLIGFKDKVKQTDNVYRGRSDSSSSNSDIGIRVFQTGWSLALPRWSKRLNYSQRKALF